MMGAVRGTASFASISLVLLLMALLHAQGTAPAAPLTLVSRDGRRPLATTIVNGQELVALEDLAATGAAAYAALEWASFATNRVNIGGDETWRHYLTWGEERLAAFHQGLAGQARRRALKARRFYTPAQPKPSQSTDWGP